MSARDITIIILLLVVLAILYKVFQASKLQTEIATKMAGKMGIVIVKPKQIREEEETEDVDAEEVEDDDDEEEDEEEVDEEEEDEEEEGEDEEIHIQEEDQQGRKISEGKAVILKVSKPKKSKLKTYEKIVPFFTDSPLYARQIIEKYTEEFGKAKPNDIWTALNYSIKKGVVVKYLVNESPKKYIYATPEMFEEEGGELKPEYQSKI